MNFQFNSSIVNPRGIPQAPFVEKVEDFIKTAEDVDPLLKQFNEMLQYVENAY